LALGKKKSYKLKRGATMNISYYGVIHGRFQVFHNDHLKYLLAGKKLCNTLIVGISNPEPSLTKPETTCQHRHKPSSNPCSYFERYLMIEEALIENGMQNHEFKIVPFPINLPDRIKYYTPHDACYFLTINDQWGEEKLYKLKNLGLETHVLWKKLGNEKGLSASQIRDAISDGNEWEYMVPKSTARIIKEYDIDARIINLSKD
jgi:nicotinamide-nucleotide adenylyltransferase